MLYVWEGNRRSGITLAVHHRVKWFIRPEFVFSLHDSIFVFLMNVCFSCVQFSFFSISQEIGWEERLRNDLFVSSGK